MKSDARHLFGLFFLYIRSGGCFDFRRQDSAHSIQPLVQLQLLLVQHFHSADLACAKPHPAPFLRYGADNYDRFG